MANKQNLKPIKLSHDEAVKNGRAGGIASGEARRRNKALRELMCNFLSQDADLFLTVWLLEHGVRLRDCTNLAALIMSVFERAMDGDVQAATSILEWAGELPSKPERETKIEKYRPVTNAVDTGEKLDKQIIEDVVIYKVEKGTVAPNSTDTARKECGEIN